QEACDEEDRITACDDNEFATNCPEQKYIDKRRMTCTGEKTSDRCKPTVALICGTEGDIFDDFCTGLPTTDADRISTCQMNGITESAGGHASCDGLISAACVMDPFEHDGCETLNNYSTALVPNFCAKDANIFAQGDCANLGNIGDLRNTYCTDPAQRFNQMCIDGNHRNDLRTAVCSDTNIFHEGCLGDAHGGKDTRNSRCQTYGINGPMGHASCAGRISSDCMTDPFTNLGCATLNNYSNDFVNPFCRNTSANTGQNPFHDRCGDNSGVRETACLAFGTAASLTLCRDIIIEECRARPFDNDGCDTLEEQIRTDFCGMLPTNRFNEDCIDRMIGNDDDRLSTCQTHGITVSAGGHATCEDRIRDDCVTNPFEHLGCNSLEEQIRTDFCGMLPTNRFNEHCINRGIGDDGDRLKTCQTYGTGEMGDATCDARIRSDCVTNPFEHLGCAKLHDFETVLKPNFCGETDDNTGKNPFNDMCDDVAEDQLTACQAHGTDADASCDAVIRTGCITKPFDNAGCATLTADYPGWVMNFCGDTNADTGSNPFHDMCTVDANDQLAACRAHGINADASCDRDGDPNNIRVACEADPFDYDGCTTLSGGTLRMTFCEGAKKFDESCLDGDNGGDNERALACQEHGITEPMGDASCDRGRNGIRDACELNAFEYLGCTTLTGDLRTTLCTTTDIFNASCLNDTNGGKTERDNECLLNGINAHSTCPEREGGLTACRLNPFMHNGCGDIPTIINIRIIYCAGSGLTGIANG
ncbi:MAG: hypothetical protein K8953_05610, partial [Proteobacteria bacterium]|nr:hypothetical protein [Pseudomonadota bacterium]